MRKRSELLIGQQEHKGREAVTLVNLKNVMTLMTFLQVCFSVVLFSCVSSTRFISFGMWPLPDHQDHEPQWDVMVKQRHEKDVMTFPRAWRNNCFNFIFILFQCN